MIETRLRDLSSSLSYTILRPTRFNDNWLRPDYLPINSAILDPSKQYSLISGDDIGNITVECFNRSEDFKGKTLSLASDEMTIEEQIKAIKEVWGLEIEITDPKTIPEAFLPTMKVSYTFIGESQRYGELTEFLSVKV